MKPETLRAVIEAARAVLPHAEARYGVLGVNMEAADIKLIEATRALEAEIAELEPNRPTGSRIQKAWGEIPAGWFVYTPDGKEFELLKTEEDGPMQSVTLRLPGGKAGAWPRPRGAKVWCKKGTQTAALSDAIDALSFSAGFKVEVVSDELPPWD